MQETWNVHKSEEKQPEPEKQENLLIEQVDRKSTLDSVSEKKNSNHSFILS